MTHMTDPGAQVAADEDVWTDDLPCLAMLDSGYVSARFGGVPVLLTPELAARVREFKDTK